MRIYTVEHDGVYLGGYSVVVAENEEEARKMVVAHLLSLHLDPNSEIELKEISPSEKGFYCLFNGDY